MARIALIEPDKANPEVKEIYEKTLRGKPGTIQKALAYRPDALKNFLTFYTSVGRSLDRRLYEVVYLRVSFLNGCNYCSQHHVASSKKAGLAHEQWVALKNGNYESFNDAEQTALRYAEKLTRTPEKVGDGDFAALRKHFSEEMIMDLNLLIGLANLTNRFTGPLDLELEFPAEQV